MTATKIQQLPVDVNIQGQRKKVFGAKKCRLKTTGIRKP